MGYEPGRVAGTALDMARRLKEEVFSDHLLMIASGMAFHGIFGVLPALAGVAVLWGLILGFDTLEGSIEASRAFLPGDAADLAREFVTSVPEGLGWGFGLALNLAIIVWSAQRAASGLITALNIVHDETEKRSRLHRAGVALAIACGGMVFLLLALALLALPPLLDPDGDPAWVLGLVRWPALAVLFILGIGVVFIVGPSRARPNWRWVIRGAAASTALWVAASYGLSVYVAHAQSFGRFYGSLGAAVVLLLWFYVSALAILIGAEINALMEERTSGHRRDGLKRALRQRERSDSA